MSLLSIRISPEQQFSKDQTGARRGRQQGEVVEAIKRHLFPDETNGQQRERGSDEACKDKSDKKLEAAIERFLDAATKFSAENKIAQELWGKWFSRERGADGSVDPAHANGRRTDIEMFCLTLHALCWALAEAGLQPAEQAVGGDDATQEDDTVDPDDPQDEQDDEDNESSASCLWVYQDHAKNSLVRVLSRYAWKQKRNEGNTAEENSEEVRRCLELMAGVLLHCLLEAMPDQFELGSPQTHRWEGKPYTRVPILAKSPHLAERVQGFLQEFPFRFTVQPLKAPVRYEFDPHLPLQIEDANTEPIGFTLDLIGYRRWNGFLRALHREAMESSNRVPAFSTYVKAINRQVAVPWRLNLSLLYWIECLIDIANAPEQEWRNETKEAVSQAGLTSEEIEGWRDWLEKNLYRPKTARKTREPIKLPAEFLDSSLAAEAISALKHMDGGEQPAFYLPWKADYRGRIYAETPWLTPQGGDVQRALLEFATGEILKEDGIIALRRHGYNLAKRRFVLHDLGILDREVLTFDERERWVKQREHAILATAVSPLKTSFWRECSRKPAQFLAFCLAYKSWKDNPQSPIHLPVQIDGSCNGLQHIAALTRNENLACAVNVLASNDGRPGDVYSRLAETTRSSIASREEIIGDNNTHHYGLKLADKWLRDSGVGQHLISREAAKRVVMTIPYGASRGAQARDVLETISEMLDQAWATAPGNPELDALVEWGLGNKSNNIRKTFIHRCTRGQFGELRRKSRGDPEGKRLLERRQVFSSYVARAIVRHIRHALAKEFDCIDEFSGWVENTAKACAGLPLLWLTPLGFLVCQDKFKIAETTVTGRLGASDDTPAAQNVSDDGGQTEGNDAVRAVARIGKETIRVKVASLSEEVHRGKQINAVLPNLIHSLDATHLAMTICRAGECGIRNIGTIHDCLMCHPNDAKVLGGIVRDTFAELYAPSQEGVPTPLIEWRDWMGLVASIRSVPQKWARMLKGALDQPGELGEQWLDDAASHDADARRVQALLEEIRQLSPLKKSMAFHLIDSMIKQELETREVTAAAAPSPGDLRIAVGSLSEYFFS